VPSTKEIAEASGVAEGTIFRAFDTKDELIDAVIAVTFCPAPLVRQLREVDLDLPLRDRLVVMVTILQQRFSELFDLMVGLGLSAPPADRMKGHQACTPDSGHVPDFGMRAQHGCAAASDAGTSEGGVMGRGQATEAVIALIEPDADLLTCSPKELARVLRLLTFSGSHRKITDGEPLTPETIVDVILSGVLDPRPAVRRRAAGIPSSSPTGSARPTGPARPTGSPRTRKAH